MAKGIHLFPFRTEKLSPLAPMVLPTGGRVGRCRIQMERVTEMWLSLFFVLSFVSRLILSYLISSCVLCTCSVFFFVMWCFGFSLSLFSAVFSVALLFFLCCILFCILCSLRCSVSSLFHFFLLSFLFLFSLVVVFAVCLPCLFLLAWSFFFFVYILFLCLYLCLLDTVWLLDFKLVLLWY